MQNMNMKYIDMIKQMEGFKYSANVRLDLMQDTSLLQYIPTQNNTEILSNIFHGINTQGYRNRQASKLIYGPYGSGKSHLVTVIASILGKTASKENYDVFLEKVYRIDRNLTEDIRSFLQSSSSYIIVPIDGSFPKFQECIYYSLTRVLDEKGIDCRFKDPYLEAIDIIKNWEKQGGTTFLGMLGESFTEQKTEKQNLIRELSNFNPQALEAFKRIFQEVTCGVEYRPKLGNLYDNLDIANEAVHNKGYKGIIFIFDEFGKFLEDNKVNIDVKVVQDFAEYCDHSVFQTHILLISHKQIMQYMDTDDIEEWRKVESRFQSISFEQNDEDIMYLMSNVLIKEGPVWNNYINKHKDNFKNLINETLDGGLYTALDSRQASSLLYGSYPLHPIVGHALSILSKKVAQNERTIFTFLAGDEENSLGAFLRDTGLSRFHFVGMDLLYDYFGDNLSRDKNSPEYQEWLQTKNSINKLNSTDENYEIKIKIVKAIGIINIINDFELIKPNDKIIKYILDEDKEKIGKAMRELLSDRIIVYLRQYKYYRFFDVSSIDIEELIDETMGMVNNTEQAIELLNSRFVHFPVLPDKYNDKYKMTRYYYPIYLLDSQIDTVDDLLNKHYHDGLLVYLLTSKAKEEIIPKLRGKRILYIIKKDSIEIINDIKKLIALEYLLTQRKSLSKKDPKAIIELEEYKKEVEEYIHNYSLSWFDPSVEDVCYIADGKILEQINSVKTLSDYMSNTLNQCFDRTLIVNNELINKNILSVPMRRARREIIDRLLIDDELLPHLGYGELSTNHTFLRSLLEINGIFEDDTILIPDYGSSNLRLRNAHYVMRAIEEFLERACVKEQNFGDIYHLLKSEPYGLRDGYIGVLLASMLRVRRHQVYIRLKGIDQDLNGELFERLGKYPNQYTILIDAWSKDKEDYISELEKAYHNYINTHNKRLNRLKALHDGMLTHYKSMSKFARTTHEYIEEATPIYRKIIEEHTTDFREFFFHRLMALGKDYQEVTLAVIKIKQDLSFADQRLIIAIREEIKQVFNLDNRNISAQLAQLYEKEWRKSSEYSLKYITNRFMEKIQGITTEINDFEMARQLAFLLTGFDPLYWSDEQIDNFAVSLREIRDDLKDVLTGEYEKREGNIQIVLEDEGGNKKKISFKRGVLPGNGKILKNLISANIDNFGQALSYEDKRQILYEILMEYV